MSAPPLAAGPLLRRIRERGYLVVGARTDLPGFGVRDPRTQRWTGLEIDLAREIARVVVGDAAKVRFRPIRTRDRTPKLRSPLSFLEPLWRLITIASSALFSNWWHLGMAGRLPKYLCPAECVGQQDFVGLDYYWGISTLRLARISRLFNALVGG